MTTALPTLNTNGVLAYATDPDATGSELVFDFIAGAVGLVLSGTDPTTGTLAETLADMSVSAAGVAGAYTYAYDWSS